MLYISKDIWKLGVLYDESYKMSIFPVVVKADYLNFDKLAAWTIKCIIDFTDSQKYSIVP